jgi:hypothetical protein
MGRYDLYELPGRVSIHPKAWGDRVLKGALYADGQIRLPFLHDLFGFAKLYPRAGGEARRKIDTVVRWVLAPEVQGFNHNYGYLRCPDGRGKSVGHRPDFPGPDSNALVLRLWQMAHFPAARQHPWFRAGLALLERFATAEGHYLFPKEYLGEAKGSGYWVHGARMGLGESRRGGGWREVESTFWILAIRRMMEG